MLNFNQIKSSSFLIKVLVGFLIVGSIIGIIVLISYLVNKNNKEHYEYLKANRYNTNNEYETFTIINKAHKDNSNIVNDKVSSKTVNKNNELYDENTFLKSYIENTI